MYDRDIHVVIAQSAQSLGGGVKGGMSRLTHAPRVRI